MPEHALREHEQAVERARAKLNADLAIFGRQGRLRYLRMI